MPASDKHPEYTKYSPLWKKIRACVEGPDAVKALGVALLPKPNPDDKSKANKTRYSQYLIRANYVNFTGMTLEGLLGMVFRKPATVELPATIEYLKDNINGDGLTLDQMSKSVLSNGIQLGRDGLLTDYPEAPAGLTKAQVKALGLQANILHYKAENIINWSTMTESGVTRLSLVSLVEDVNEYAADGFSFEAKKYTRVLRLIEGVYMQALYNEDDEIVSGPFVIKKADGSPRETISFTFIGSENNDSKVDKPPLADIAEVNIGHYRNSADFEESSFIVGQPTPVFSGLNQAWVEANMSGDVGLGSFSGVVLPEGANAQLLQAQANTMPETGMTMKEQQIVKLGARIIQDSSGVETAEAAKIRYAGQNSKLGTVVGNVEGAFIKCFGWALEFMGGDGDIEFELNREYYDKTLDPQLIMAQIALADRGHIAADDLRDNLRVHGVISADRTNEQIKEEAENLNL